MKLPLCQVSITISFRRLEALFSDPCVQARSVRVNGQHRCTLAHGYTDPPRRPVCIVFLLFSSVCSVEATVCVSCSLKGL